MVEGGREGELNALRVELSPAAEHANPGQMMIIMQLRVSLAKSQVTSRKRTRRFDSNLLGHLPK